MVFVRRRNVPKSGMFTNVLRMARRIVPQLPPVSTKPEKPITSWESVEGVGIAGAFPIDQNLRTGATAVLTYSPTRFSYPRGGSVAGSREHPYRVESSGRPLGGP